MSVFDVFASKNEKASGLFRLQLFGAEGRLFYRRIEERPVERAFTQAAGKAGYVKSVLHNSEGNVFEDAWYPDYSLRRSGLTPMSVSFHC